MLFLDLCQYLLDLVMIRHIQFNIILLVIRPHLIQYFDIIRC